MANYTLHLGFNWNSPTVGSLWGGTDTGYRFLQYALADDNAHSQFFTFNKNDTFSVVIWNLGSEALPNDPEGKLDISLSSLVAPAQTYKPTDYLTLPSNANQLNLGANDFFQFTPIFFGNPVAGCPWGIAQQVSTGQLGPMTFSIDNARFKLSFKLTISCTGERGTETQIYISDPEVIVGSMGN